MTDPAQADERCPTCGSNDPRLKYVEYTPPADNPSAPCPDPWHLRAEGLTDYSAGFSKPGIGERETPWPSYGGDPFGGYNPTCATCGGRLRGKKKCACEEPEWRVKGQLVETPRRSSSVKSAPKLIDGWKILEGDCVEQMRELPEASVDAIVTDPPYGLEFMGKEWDRLLKDPSGSPHARKHSVSFVNPGNPTCRNCGGLKSLESEGSGGRTKCRCDSPDFPNHLLPRAQAMQEWHQAWATEALRVLKPGGHLLAFGGTRTYHRLVCAIEDAGFEIRDCLVWMYGSGFPKSLDVSKAIDKAGICPVCKGTGKVGEYPSIACSRCGGSGKPTRDVVGVYESPEGTSGASNHEDRIGTSQRIGGLNEITAPATPEATQWEGWGTALKPAHEPIVVARKPLSGTVAQNVLEHGTGALNIDGCRIEGTVQSGAGSTGFGADREDDYELGTGREYQSNGRWPANVALSHLPECEKDYAAPFEENDGTDFYWACAPGCFIAMLDEQSGERPSGARNAGEYGGIGSGPLYGDGGMAALGAIEANSGGASRFFYCAKSSRGERNAGLDGFEERWSPTMGDGIGGKPHSPPGEGVVDGERVADKRNVHPLSTVKPIDLMRWLVRLVTPPGGTCLDPFIGSGTTGIAAVLEGFDFIGIEREPEYVEIARARIEWWSQHEGKSTEEILEKAGYSEKLRREYEEAGQLGLLGDVT